ncbi:MAG: HyaD/HybD family hydrogenase maturation endopeptidase [Sedimentisphaerales bacterium]
MKNKKITSASSAVSAVRKNVVVIGLGNVLLSDEGVGVHIVKRLSEQQAKFPFVNFIDAGSAGLSLLHLIANRKKAVIIDCAKMGASTGRHTAKPGTIKRFAAGEVQSIKRLSRFSLHEVDILQVITLSKQLGECPGEIVFFGIEPESLEPGQELSRTLSARIDGYIADICKEIV